MKGWVGVEVFDLRRGGNEIKKEEEGKRWRGSKKKKKVGRIQKRGRRRK